ncbi:MAG: elongation factor G [Nitrospira sp.]|nr:elongation factor G [Nitrospira sp.]MBH0182644.1 elongation factor G [Nitrospira sp.]
MDNIRVGPIRNVAIVSNVGAGKTSLSEAILFASGAVPVLGSIAQGTTVSDFEPEELHHRSSVSTSVLQFSWNQTTISLLDPPGALSLLGEPLSALRAVDAALIVLDGQAGVRTELSRLWVRIEELGLPCLFFVNGLDRDGASIDHALETCRTQLNCIPIPMVVPVGLGPQLEGVIDILQERFIGSGPATAKVQILPVPAHFESAAKEGRSRLMEAVAETEDALLNAYVAQGDLNRDMLFSGLRSGILRRQVFPLYAGSAVRNLGVWSLINALTDLLPSPSERCAVHPSLGVQPSTDLSCERKGSAQEPFSSLVFKTLIDPFVGRLSYCRILSGTVHADSLVWNASKQVREKLGHFYTLFGKRHTAVASASAGEIVAIGKLHDTYTGDTLCDEKNQICYPAIGLPRPVLSFAIEAMSKAEIEKVSLGLHKLIEEDPTLAFSRNAETKEMVLSSLGQLHIDLAVEKLHRKFGAGVTLHMPKIPYHETVHATAQAQGKYKKQTGGHGQYGDCWLEVAPLPRGGGFIFEHRVVGGAIPRNFIPAVEKGVSEAMHEGVLGGFPVVDVRVAVYDGSYHVVDSSEMSFKIAGSMAFKKAMETAQPVLLEPMMTVEIEAPTDAVGAVMGDLNARRGRILSVNANDHAEQIVALVPLAELLKYAPALNGMTGGRGSYVMEFARYEEVPRELAGKIVEQHKMERQAVGAH